MEAAMSALAEVDTIGPQTIEPTVNYLTNDGTEVFTYTGGARLTRRPHRRQAGPA